MAWEKSSAELIALFHKIAPSGAHIQHKMMFGYPCGFVGGHLFGGLFQQYMLFRLSPGDAAAFLDRPGTAEFEPMPGRKMKGFVVMHAPLAADEGELADWMRCALEFAAGLPPKKKAAKKK